MAKGESKSYVPAEHERRIFAQWEQSGAFHPMPDDRPREKRFCMVIPPPNVTGALHLGHALNNTLQDILIRRKRMEGCNTFWLLGTDHAGIATQAMVEKTIRNEEGKSRHDLGREELVRRIWAWKEKFGGRIVEQLKLMGCSCDYSRERFTLDEGCAKAVRETFFKMFRDGLIYRGKRLVNWDTQLQTAVADDEVYHEEVKGHFYHFKYPVKDPKPGEPTHVHVATTRPETMLGDTAVAVHPDPSAALDKLEKDLRAKLSEASQKDKAGIQAQLDDIVERRTTTLPTLLRLRDMARDGRKIILPLMEREIPLICDEWAQPNLGSGCVKITPAHDPNDYDVFQRQSKLAASMFFALQPINVMTPDGRVNEFGGAYKGLKFADARKKIVEDLEARGLVVKIEDRLIDLAHSDRSNQPIEPYLSDQWFVRMGDLSDNQAACIQNPYLRTQISVARSDAVGQVTGMPDTGASGSDQARKLPGLAQMAINVVKSGKVKFYPPRYENTYVDWLSEKRDWCISRQLWWGHRIPVWKGTVDATDDTIATALSGSGLLDIIKSQSPGIAATIRVFEHAHEKDIDEIQVENVYQCTIEQASNGRLFLIPDSGEIYDLESEHEDPFDGTIEVTIPLAHSEDREHLEAEGFKQDPDVLDTWFSSALWPHSTLGWPDDSSSDSAALPYGRGSDLLRYFYPTSVLSTAREIITLWVARMVITGLYNIGELPFSDVFIHPLIQDGQGRKMSKTAGNGVDPADIIEEYGADALRFTLAELATETQDIRLPVKPKKLPDGRTINVSEKFEKGRNFCNKLWQAATGFVIPNLAGYSPKPLDPKSLGLVDRWILSRMAVCEEEINAALDRYRFSDAVGCVYRFMWDEYCSWYIEMTKPRLTPDQSRDREGAPSDARTPTSADQASERATAQQVLVFVLDRLLRMLHPIVPFVTEAIWEELNKAAPSRGLQRLQHGEPMMITAAWPQPDPALRDKAAEAEMESLHAIIRSLRDIRSDVNDYRGRSKVPSIRSLPSATIRADEVVCKLVDRYRDFIRPLAGCDLLEVGPSAAKPPGAMSRVEGSIQVYAPVASLVDLAEVKRAEEAKLEELRAAISREEARLSSDNFVKRADPSVVQQARQRVADLSSRIRLIETHLSELL